MEKWIDSVLPDENRKKIKELCRTRWVERHEAFEVFSDLFLPTYCCLEAIFYESSPSDWNRETRSEAQSLLLAMSQFSFVVALVLSQKILAYTKGLSIKLQGRYVDVVRAHRDIQSVKTTLKNVRYQIDHFHNQVYQEAISLGQTVHVIETGPRMASRQQHRQNIPSVTICEYYKRNFTIPFLDHLNSELDSRFDDYSSQRLVQFMQLLPFKVISSTVRLTPDNFEALIDMYSGDMHAFCEVI